MKKTLAFIIALLPFLLAAQSHNVPQQAPFIPDMSMSAAKAYCDTAPIRDPEGIYLWPEKQAIVLIKSSDKMRDISTQYQIINIESENILIEPGLILGYIYPSASPKEYHAYIYHKIKKDKTTNPKHKAAKYSATDNSFKFEGPDIKFSFNPLALIPRMRSIIRINKEDPTKNIPQGLQRIYPLTNAPTPQYPRYL